MELLSRYKYSNNINNLTNERIMTGFCAVSCDNIIDGFRKTFYRGLMSRNNTGHTKVFYLWIATDIIYRDRYSRNIENK